MTLIPRYLAGPGTPDTALGVLRNSRWRIESDDKANVFAFAPDRRVVVAFLPEPNDFAPRVSNWPVWEPLWVIRAYTHGDLPDVVWEATFTSDTPAEFIAALLVDLVRKASLDLDRDEPAPPPLASD